MYVELTVEQILVKEFRKADSHVRVFHLIFFSQDNCSVDCYLKKNL